MPTLDDPDAVRLRQVVKSFAATKAVDDVSLGIQPGEIVALVGENGAGKTTLVRLMTGELVADAGEIAVRGNAELVHQHFALVGDFTIAENLVLGDRASFRVRSLRAVRKDASAMIERTGIDLPEIDRRVDELSVGERAKVELIKALSRDPSVLILDEPTSVLTPLETAELFRTIRNLSGRGTAVVFVSHKLPEVFELTGRIVAMRRGKIVADVNASESDANSLADAMVGDRRVVETTPPIPRASAGEVRLSVVHLSSARLEDATFEVRAGEIVGIIGVAGNGQDQLARALRGLDRPVSGQIQIKGEEVAFIPEDRTRDGVIAEMTIAENLALPSHHWDPRTAERRARELIESYSIRATSPLQRAGTLSGGNQQKLILARELDRNPSTIVAAEPTRGLDIDSTAFVHAQLRAARDSGAAILLITSDLDETLTLSDWVHVIYRGRLSERMSPNEAQARAPRLMAGLA